MNGQTYRGEAVGKVFATAEVKEHLLSGCWVEWHPCPECNEWLVVCTAHSEGLYCADCGVSF